ncbi:hypothetical protein FLL45_18580 [Aliikangiella marina]|uniref:Uncharacterized protein n=1 Tax=Aliikangiella marina TaxID=1712262 RepID=A0A545T4U0_9GAMM|nr:hypothetical protein [Aliikangiella marina]TQV72226.1 hypothetical protein FLL45_18580 [Aliikangiella marina]
MKKIIITLSSLFAIFLAVRYSPMSGQILHQLIADIYPAFSGETDNMSTRGGQTFLLLNVSFLVFSLVLGLVVLSGLAMRKHIAIYAFFILISICLVAVASPFFWPREVLMRVSGMLLLLFVLAFTAGLWTLLGYYYAKLNDFAEWHQFVRIAFKGSFFLVVSFGLMLVAIYSVILSWDLWGDLSAGLMSIESIATATSVIFGLLITWKVFANDCQD